MKSPPRLLHDDPGFARLVDAIRKDGPSDAQMSKALSLANEVATFPVARESAPVWFGLTTVTIGLTLAGITLVGALAAPFAASSFQQPPTAASAAPSPVLTAPAAHSSRPDAPPEAAVVSVRVDDLPSAPIVPTAAIRGAPRASDVTPGPAQVEPREHAVRSCPPGSTCGATSGQGTFAEELALTSEARAALRRGDTRECLSAADRYQRKFRTGTFAQEIDVMRIEALANSGARARAHASAEKFLIENSSSPYADRVRSVLENTK